MTDPYAVMSEQTSQRPPKGGPGSGVDAWRAYAAQVTGTPVEEWAEMTRDEIAEKFADEPDAPEPMEPVAPIGDEPPEVEALRKQREQ